MIDVELLGIIRRWHIRDQVPLREIARRLGISRNTVRRYLRAEMVEPAYPERRGASAIDKYAVQLAALLKTEASKSRKQRRTLKQIHEDLKELGFEGSYDRVAAFARVWREGQIDRVNSASKRTDWHTDVMSAPTSGQKIAIFSRLRKYEGVSCEEQIQEGRERTISKLLDMPIWISRADLSRLKRYQGEGTEQIDHWINERKIFAVEGGGLQLLAKFQFDDAYSPLPVIAKILELLKSRDDWAVASWFAFPNGWISPRRAEACESLPPMYALDDEAAVIRAAQNELGTYFA